MGNSFSKRIFQKKKKKFLSLLLALQIGVQNGKTKVLHATRGNIF